MKSLHLYEVKLLDGSKYRGEIAYRDEKMVIIRPQTALQDKIRLYYCGIMWIQDVGWRKIHAE